MRTVSDMTSALHHAWRLGLITPREPHCDWLRHVYRELNTVADNLATQALRTRTSKIWTAPSRSHPRRLRAWFDGGSRDNETAAGWVVQGSWTESCIDRTAWQMLATGSIYLGPGTSTKAELTAGSQAIKAAISIIVFNIIQTNADFLITMPSAVHMSEARTTLLGSLG
eukprot:10182356-Karenia_brevis.AAC.1